MLGDDAIGKFSKHLCEFLDTIRDMPVEENLVFRIEVKKLRDGYYHLKNPTLKIDDEKRIIQ